MSDTIPTPSWIAHVLPPAIVMLLAAPVAVQPQMYLSDQGDTSSLAFRIWLFTPFWIGLVAAPGYLRAIHLMRKGLGSHAAAAPWIWISVGLGMIACVGGIAATWSIMMPLFPIGSAISLVAVLHIASLLRTCRQRPVVTEVAGGTRRPNRPI